MSNVEVTYSINLYDRRLVKEVYKEQLKKYSSDETIDKLEENLDAILSASFNMIIFPIIAIILSLIISIIFGIFNDYIFGITLFLSLIPISLLGIGAFGIAKALSDYYNGILYILKYIISVSIQIKKSSKNSDLPPLKIVEIAELVLKIIVLPLIKKKFRNNIFGGIIYFILKHTILKADEECFESSLEIETLKLNLDKSKKRFKLLNNVHPFILKTLNFILKIVTIFLISIGILASLFSVVLIIIILS